jgi:hypothetical protein
LLQDRIFGQLAEDEKEEGKTSVEERVVMNHTMKEPITLG